MQNGNLVILLFALIPIVALGIGSDSDQIEQIIQIQAEIDRSAMGDTVFIKPGVYSGLHGIKVRRGNRSQILLVALKMKSGVSVFGATRDPADVVIDCGGKGYGVLFQGVDSRTSLCGVTVRNAFWGVSGDSSAPVIVNCIFENNGGEESHNSAGAGMYFDRSSPTVIDCIFRRNSARSGGGACFSMGSTVVMRRCLFIENNASSCGGGMVVGDDSEIYLENCVVSKNSAAESGGGLYAGGGSIRVIGGSIVGNSANYRGGGCDLYFLSKPAKFDLVTIQNNYAPLGQQGFGIPTQENKLFCCETDTFGWEGWFSYDCGGDIWLSN